MSGNNNAPQANIFLGIVGMILIFGPSEQKVFLPPPGFSSSAWNFYSPPHSALQVQNRQGEGVGGEVDLHFFVVSYGG